jgi:hypothetical protein
MWVTLVEAVHKIFPNKKSRYIKVGRDKVQEPFAVALQTAELALQHAADAGKEIPKEIITPITDAKYGYKHSSLDANSEASFWEAFTKIRTILGLESLEAIGNEASDSALRMRKRYGRIGVFLLILLIPLSVISLTSDGFITDIKDRIARVCDDKDKAYGLNCSKGQLENQESLTNKKFFVGVTT